MKVFVDEYQIGNHEGCFLVFDDKSFVEARKMIIDYKLLDSHSKDIAIIKHPYSSWFFDIEQENSLKVEFLLPSKLLSQKYKEFDKDLSEKDIIVLDLLNETIEPTEVAIINKYIGAFLFKNLDLKHLLYNTAAYITSRPKQFESSIYLQKKWYKFLEKFETNNFILQKVLAKVKEADLNYCKILQELVYVSNSSFLLQEFIHDNRAYLESTIQCSIIDLEKLLLESKIDIKINELIDSRLINRYKNLYKTDRDLFFSEHGGYKASLTAFLMLTKSITTEQKEFIYKNYEKSIDYEIENTIKSLIKPELKPPPSVEGLSFINQIQSWQNWAIDYFIPYKFYLDEAKNEEDFFIVEEYANSYSDWLYKSYASIIQNNVKTNYNVTRIINDDLNEFRAVWLIIDGFPAIYTNLLQAVLRSNGINKITTNFHFAALPTITSIGIPTQLGGKTPQSQSYTLDREEALRSSFIGKQVVFRNAVASFQTALDSEYDVCCLHWKDIDKFMHEEDNQIEGTRSDEVRRLLEIRIKQISNVIKSNTDKKIKLFISTDHGSTKCLMKGRAIKNTILLEACKDNPKERCIELTARVANTQIDEEEVYHLKSEHTLNTGNWAIARGYRYFGRFDFGYRHGGMTPEETIVPMICCEVAQDEILPIKISYSNLSEIQLGFTETFRLTIRNDNDAIVQIHNIFITEDKNANVDVKEPIEPLSSKSYNGKIKLSKATTVKDGKAQLSVIVSYSLFGTKYSTSANIQALIKKSVNDNLDNLFS